MDVWPDGWMYIEISAPGSFFNSNLFRSDVLVDFYLKADPLAWSGLALAWPDLAWLTGWELIGVYPWGGMITRRGNF